MHNLISPLPFLLFMAISLAVGFTTPPTGKPSRLARNAADRLMNAI
jgi:hypothetical protein